MDLTEEQKKIKPPFHRRTIRVQCFPLYSVLLALGNPVVDYFSLDIEGAEFPVLKTVPFDKVRLRQSGAQITSFYNALLALKFRLIFVSWTLSSTTLEIFLTARRKTSWNSWIKKGNILLYLFGPVYLMSTESFIFYRYKFLGRVRIDALFAQKDLKLDQNVVQYLGKNRWSGVQVGRGSKVKKKKKKLKEKRKS